MKTLTLFIRKYAHIIFVVLFAVAFVAIGIFAIGNNEDHVVLNEICPSNVKCCMDENGEFPDWIEIYNPSDHDMDLSGYSVTESTDLQKVKFDIPEGTILAPGSFYLFDPIFLMSSQGCTINLLDRRKHYIDRIEIPKLKWDTTYARVDDGGDEWSIKEPTPGYSNADGKKLEPVAEGLVIASADSGFYDSEFDLRLASSNMGRQIYYTTDGRDPVKYGTLYEGPIHIYDRSGDANLYSAIPDVSLEYTEGRVSPPQFPVDKCTVVRAVTKDALGRYTDISTFTYFVGFNEKHAYDNMAVVSVIADPYDLFSGENGIMVLGDSYERFVAEGAPEDYASDKANFIPRGRRSERFANIEVFDEDHKRTLDVPCGIRIKGMSSRWDVQKSLSVVFHRAYGGNYKESFTVDNTVFDVHSFALDKCGQDVGTKMKDTIMEYAMRNTDCATTDRVPCSVFINGEYWGFYWITNRFDNSFIADKYGVDINDVFYKNIAEFQEGEWIQEEFDRQSLIDCYAANVIISHARDWPHYNFRVWKTLTDEGTFYGDGKWRPVIFDINSASMELVDYDLLDFMVTKFYPFTEICNDDENFRQDLVDRIDEMRQNEFDPVRIDNMIDDLYARIHDQMILDRMRYFNCSEEEAEAFFDDSVKSLKDFYDNRWEYLDRYEEKFLNGE
ncbi:MAG: CotH kinase family protein [Lachnospiraceae bacterium]|nr:CotH kinase family protein [Lachnospiraceae bacterium]